MTDEEIKSELEKLKWISFTCSCGRREERVEDVLALIHRAVTEARTEAVADCVREAKAVYDQCVSHQFSLTWQGGATAAALILDRIRSLVAGEGAGEVEVVAGVEG